MRFPRSCGVLLHPTSLPGRFGIGELGTEARAFMDFLAEAGQSVWQAVVLGPILLKLNEAATVYVPITQVAPGGLAVDPASLDARHDHLRGAQSAGDTREYRVWQKRDDIGGPAGRYLVNDAGQAAWLVDPGINGQFNTRPDGTTVHKFDAPKATLMSYIIRGILDRHLPWGLVLFGVMIAVVLELSGIPSLAFAVGVYLPLSSSSPILIGGAVRWFVDRARRKELAHRDLTEDQLVAEGDKSPGVLMASGYIAGGAIAGIGIAFLAGVMEKTDGALQRWAETSNPFYGGPNANLLSVIPFAVLTLVLLLVGREKLLGGPRRPA